MSSTSNHSSTSSTTVRMDYSKYVADITGSPKATRHSAVTGIGHHINPLHNQYPSRPSQANQQQQQQQQQQGAMPQYGGGVEKCARCSKTVYIAERKLGAGRPFHTSCFSCYTCHRKLDSTVLSEHKGEIYCKACYTKQFGAHGLISGVTMSTEQTTGRRPSYGNELDAAGTTDRYSRQRTNSSENLIYNDEHANQNNRSPTKYTQRTDRSPEQSTSSSRKSSDGINAVVDTQYQRSSSRKSYDGINAVAESAHHIAPSPAKVSYTDNNDHRHRSTYMEEDDRSKYVYEGEKLSYGSGASAVVHIPVISQTKQPNAASSGYEIPIERTSSHQGSGSRSPSVTSNDSYRRQSSRERQTDFTDDYSRMNINEDGYKINRTYSNDHNMNALPSENPLASRTYQSSSSSSYETRHGNTNVTSHSPSREQYHSRDSSPATGYVSTSTTRTSSTTYQSGVSPSKTYTSQYEHRSNETSSNPNSFTNRSPSPLSNHRTSSSGLTDFVSKTNLAGNASSSRTGQTSALSALAAGFGPLHHSNDDDN